MIAPMQFTTVVTTRTVTTAYNMRTSAFTRCLCAVIALPTMACALAPPADTKYSSTALNWTTSTFVIASSDNYV